MSKRRKAKGLLENRQIAVLTVEVRGQSYDLDVAGDLAVARNISEEFDRQPGLYAWYGVIAEEAMTEAKLLKNQLKAKEEDARQKLESLGQKLSIPAMDAAIGRTPGVRRLRKRFTEADGLARYLSVIKTAFEQRASMLQSKGALMRARQEFSITEKTERVKARSKRRRT